MFRFQWSVFLYLICIVPPIWILELHKLERWAELVNSTYVNKPINYQVHIHYMLIID